MEIGTALAILGSASITKPMLERLLGPTVDYMGDGLRDLTEKRARNIATIITKASRKAETLDSDGQVPPRVIKNVFDDGSFNDDELMAEYLGGVLASSKSPEGRDDRGVALSSLVNRLSSYTVRTHYIVYAAIRRANLGSDLNIGVGEEARLAATYVSLDAYNSAMAFGESEDAVSAMSHAFFALAQEQLVGHWSTGSAEHLRKYYSNAPGDGIILRPTVSGVELFLWAHGKGHKKTAAFLDQTENFRFDMDLSIDPSAISLMTQAQPQKASEAPETSVS